MKPRNFPARKLKRSLENVGSQLNRNEKVEKPEMGSEEVKSMLLDARNIRTKKHR